ncbi:MAG: hypothetical protein H7Y86_15770 [Rhizobacter sp.]|nr:hypothetical protein [Ferruginibacter sp.]
MKFAKRSLFPLFFILLVNTAHAQQTTLISDDFKTLTGCWEGNLNYLDYSTNKPYSMPANLVITPIPSTFSFSVSNIYPDEPKANSIDTFLISNEKKQVNKEVVQSRTKLKDGSLQIITEAEGRDGNDNKKAIFRHTFILGENSYLNKKEVRFAGTSKWITRHEYKYVRCKK